MNRSIVLGAASAALGLALVSAPNSASASCSDRKATGTIIGGIGGALIGNSIAGGGGGAILGGLGGAVAGHAIAGSGCGRYRHDAYYYERAPRYRHYSHYNRDYGYAGTGGAYAPRAQTVYYDSRGNPISSGGYGSPAYTTADYRRTSNCGVSSQSWYDSRGNLITQPVSNCR